MERNCLENDVTDMKMNQNFTCVSGREQDDFITKSEFGDLRIKTRLNETRAGKWVLWFSQR